MSEKPKYIERYEKRVNEILPKYAAGASFVLSAVGMGALCGEVPPLAGLIAIYGTVSTFLIYDILDTHYS